MKQSLILLVLTLTVSCCIVASHYEGYVEQSHPFGAKHFKKVTSEGSHSIVHLPPRGFFSEPEHFEQYHASLLTAQNNMDDRLEAQNQALLTCGQGDGSDFFKISPAFVTTLTVDVPSFQFSAPCFEENAIELSILDDNTVEVVHTHESSTDVFCSDAYIYSTLVNYHVEVFVLSGKHTTTLQVSAAELEQIKTTGIFIFRVCDKTLDFIPDLLKTIELFLGGFGLSPNIPFFGSKPTSEEEEANIKFIYEATGYQWQERPQNVVIDLDESLLNSGDFLAITRFDGLDQIIEYGTGSHAGHSTMILKVDGETYVVESQAAWYWPKKNIQMNPYKQWIEWARNAGFMVTWLPLKREFSEKFDSDAAYKFFKTIEGTPYGYHNFLFGWIDTPDHSYPSLLAPQFLGPVFAIVEKISPEAAAQVYSLGMNMRLGTVNLTVAEIAMEAASRGLTLPDLYAQVEIDGWVYPDGVSYVCSSFVVAMYKAGGLFADLHINAVEFTPRDLYQLEFIDPSPVVPDNCKAVDPTNPYCQIMGKYRMEFPGIGTLTPYDNMNEKCWSEVPSYERFPANC